MNFEGTARPLEVCTCNDIESTSVGLKRLGLKWTPEGLCLVVDQSMNDKQRAEHYFKTYESRQRDPKLVQTDTEFDHTLIKILTPEPLLNNTVPLLNGQSSGLGQGQGPPLTRTWIAEPLRSQTTKRMHTPQVAVFKWAPKKLCGHSMHLQRHSVYNCKANKTLAVHRCMSSTCPRNPTRLL